MTQDSPPPTSTRSRDARSIMAGCLLLAGAGLLIYGIWLIHQPSAFVAAGLLLLAEGIAEARR